MKYVLSKRQKEALRILHEDGADIVCSKGGAYIGNERTNMKLVHSLLRMAVIKDVSDNFEFLERYEINGDGIQALKDGYIERPW